MLLYERKQMYVWEKCEGHEELFKVDHLGRLKEKVTGRASISDEESKDFAEMEEHQIEELISFGKDEPDSSTEDSEADVSIPTEFAELIQNINMKEWQLKYIFSSDIIDSISNYLINIEITRFLNYELCKDMNLQADLRKDKNAVHVLGEELVNNIEIIKFGIKYFFTVILRSNHNRSKLVAPICKFIQTAAVNNIAVSLFITQLFTYDHIITEMLMRVPLITFETSVASLVNTAAGT